MHALETSKCAWLHRVEVSKYMPNHFTGNLQNFSFIREKKKKHLLITLTTWEKVRSPLVKIIIWHSPAHNDNKSQSTRINIMCRYQQQ